MDLHVLPATELKGTITIPGSKSQSVRALLLAVLANGESKIHNLPDCDDVGIAMQVCKDLGAKVEKISCHENCVRVVGSGVPLSGVAEKIWTGNSGITTRFVLPILGLLQEGKVIEVDCGKQMQKRPIESFLGNLRELAMKVDGTWPLRISGKLSGGKIEVDGLTSQYISALLLSGFYANGDLELHVKNLNERPYVEMTLKWLQDLGIDFRREQNGDEDIFIVHGGQKIKPFEYFVPGDFSSAATFLAAGVLLPGEVHLENLDTQDPQGDRRFLEILKEMGADIQIDKRTVILCGGKSLKGLCIDANDIPDLVPTLAVLGTQVEGRMEIKNVPQARYKETDRLHSMAEGLKKMGAKIEEREDGLVVGKSNLKGAVVHGYNDHRTIMALSLAGLLANGETVIDTAEGLNKTYPQFGDHFNKLKAKLVLK